MKKQIESDYYMTSKFSRLVNQCLLIGVLLFIFGCQETFVPSPKPRAFPKIEFPDKKYQISHFENCPFQFEIPSYTQIERDSLFFNNETPNTCWFNLNLGKLNGTVHCSYYELRNKTDLNKFINDAYKLAGKHNSKANFIDELLVKNPNNVTGVIFDIEGPVASPFQFYLTDSTNHFVRGSLYFNTKTKPDSLAPIYEFVKSDIAHMINTFSWK